MPQRQNTLRHRRLSRLSRRGGYAVGHGFGELKPHSLDARKPAAWHMQPPRIYIV